MTTTKTFEIGKHLPSGGVRTGCLRAIDVMKLSIFNNRHGVVPRRQVGTVPGHHGSSQATGTSDSRQEAGMRQSRPTSFNLQSSVAPSSFEGKKHRCLLYTGDTPKLKSPLLFQGLRDFQKRPERQTKRRNPHPCKEHPCCSRSLKVRRRRH